MFLLLVLTDLPAAAQDEAQATLGVAIGEILSVGAPPVTDIDAALGSGALAELKQLYAARNDRPIWLGSDAGRALLDRLSQPDLVIGPKLAPLLDDARKRLDATDPPTRAGADLLLTALYGATAQALRPSRPAGFAQALAELKTATDPASLLREPEPPKVETTPAQPQEIEAPKVETPTQAPSESPAIARLRALGSSRDAPASVASTGTCVVGGVSASRWQEHCASGRTSRASRGSR